MKQCPKCKAEIQEEARFCLYCMTSFEEKQTIEIPKENNKRWPIIIAAIFLLSFSVTCILLFTNKGDSTNGENDASSPASVSGDTSPSPEQQDGEPQGHKTSTTTSGDQAQSPSQSEGDTTNNPAANNSTTGTHAQNGNNNNTTTNSASTNATSSGNKTENSTSNTGSSTSATTTSSQISTITYIYRDAKYGDDFSVSANLENAVVITGVNTAAANGEYIIPETIDGKRVVAIMASAFCDDGISHTVKTVIMPSTVRTIWNYAFATCYNLTDIYFKGNSIYTESQAFPEASKRNGTLTIHCSADCNDRNFRYYKNSASYYDALYAEWNG